MCWKKPFAVYAILLLSLSSCDLTSGTKKVHLSATVSPGEGGTITPPGGEYLKGVEITLKAQPTEYWLFLGWDGDLVTTSPEVTITLDQDYNVVGLFKKKEYPLNITTEGEGTVREEVVTAKTYEHGTVVRLTAVPAEGWKFVEWSGDASGSDDSIEITVDEEKTVTARFERRNYSFVMHIEGEGKVEEEVISGEKYLFESEIKLTAVPADQWAFLEWSGDLTGSENPAVITILSDKEITATFGQFAAVTTSGVSDITKNSAVTGGNVTMSGSASVTDRGVCYAMTENPTTSDDCVSSGSGTGSFTVHLTGLSPNTRYYVRAYATSSIGTSYGQQILFRTERKPFVCGDDFEDIDENIYRTIEIGGQCWMKENLRTSRYQDGSAIQNITDSGQWGEIDFGAWSYYDNDSENHEPFGKLYNWFAVDDSRGLCPVEWRVPGESDWMALTDYLGGWTAAGGKMKETGTQYWESPNRGATNESGFSGLPGGGRESNGNFAGMGQSAFFWSATRDDVASAWARDLYYDDASVWTFSVPGSLGMSVRCIRINP